MRRPFTDGELSLEVKENKLTIRGEKHTSDVATDAVLYQGIAARSFERTFQLAEYVEVKDARTVCCTLISCANSRKR